MTEGQPGEGPRRVLYVSRRAKYFWEMETINGIDAMRWAKEISRLPECSFTISFFPYSRSTGTASGRLSTRTGCRWREQLPRDRFRVASENYLLFVDSQGRPRACYRILIRYIGFPNDGYKLHKIEWL
jgi:hypothetical protein